MKRHQRTRAKGYKTPENTKYIGRPTKLGNPFRLTKEGFIECYNLSSIKKWIIFKNDKKYTLEDVIELYEKWLNWEFVNTVEPFLPPPPRPHEIKELKAFEYLSCFCPLHQPCHVDVVLKYLENHP